jgi:hypothetical protein
MRGYLLVLVRWLDAEGCDSQETVESVQREAVGVETESLGHLIRDDAAGVVIAQSNVGADGRLSGRLSVPRAYVREVRRLAVKREAKVKAVQP